MNVAGIDVSAKELVVVVSVKDKAGKAKSFENTIDAGNHLIIRYGKQQERVALTNILDVDYFKRNPNNKVSSWLIKLQLKTAGKFGKEINFYPSQRMGFMRLSMNSHPIVEDLNTRIRNIRVAASTKNLHDIEQL